MYTKEIKQIVNKLISHSPKCCYREEDRFLKQYISQLIKSTPFLPIKCRAGERIYCIKNNITERPKCYCKKTDYLVFKTFIKGYRKHCSKNCSNKDPKKIQHSKEVCLKKWGYVSTAQSPIVKEKFHKTCKKRYGVSAPHKNKQIRNKFKKTMNERYGVDATMQSEELKQKFINTSLKKYGTQWPSQNIKIKEKIFKNRQWDVQIGNNEKELLDKQEKINNCNIERSVKFPPFTLDGYCKETNTVYEVYEKYHSYPKQKSKDKQRQQYIEEKLNCDYVVIWDL